MAKRSFDAKLAKLQALRSADDAPLLAGLQKALEDRSNYVVAKAAAIAGERYVTGLIPDLIRTYNQLFEEGADPLALGKHAIAQALKDLDHREPDIFLRGLHHEQFEPVFGGKQDMAGRMRAACAHALVACDIDESTLLTNLVDHVHDPDKAVRLDVVRAIAETGGHAGILLLRMKALGGDPDAEVVGECLISLLHRQPRESLTFVERFLCNDDEDVQFEAVNALAQSREPEAFAILRRFWQNEMTADLRRAMVQSFAASPFPEAADFLLSMIDRHPDLAVTAIGALGASRFAKDFGERARQAADRSRDPSIMRAWTEAFGADER